MAPPARTPSPLSGGRALREARERQGLTLEQVAAQARIQRRYLEALENDDASAFPKGPFLNSYLGQYRKLLGVGDAPTPRVLPYTPEPTFTSTSPRIGGMRLPRALALSCAVGLVLGLGIAVYRESRPDKPAREVGVDPDLKLSITVVEPVRAAVVADGRPGFSGALAAGTQHPFAAHDRLEVRLGSLDQVTLVYGGVRLKPLGAQGQPRTLVFIDDEGR
jgi:transcriptional regulator with XRE-family HTH domain